MAITPGTLAIDEPATIDKRADTNVLTRSATTVQREVVSIGSPDDTTPEQIAAVTAANALKVDGSAVTQPISAASLPLPTGAATAALQLPNSHDVTVDNAAGASAVNVQDGGNSLTVDNATISVVGGGAEATAQRVTIANDSTGVLSVDDNGGTLTVDQATATNLKAEVVSISSDNSANATTKLAVIAARANAAAPTWTEGNQAPLSVDLSGRARIDNSTWIGSTAPTVGQKTMANSLPVAVASDQGNVPVSQATAASLNAEVQGDAASDAPVSGNPVLCGGRASTALPAAVSADGDAVSAWFNRSGARVVAVAPHIGLNSDPYNLLHAAAQYTTTQTSTVLLAGGASEKIVVTKLQIQVGGTTAGTLQVYFGTAAYSRGTSRAIFDGEFAPSATLKPGVIRDGPFISGTNGDDVLVTTSAAINPLTISIWYYIVT